MGSIRRVSQTWGSTPTIEGAGVRLQRAFGYETIELTDPFLMLDDFHSTRPKDYMAGFPWHPHRGIETVTYMISGAFEHGDSIGNKGVIKSGDIQWMTAGSGIIHQEMPQEHRGNMQGFQLWVNLPRKSKMTEPKYRDVKAAQMPEVLSLDGAKVKIIAGAVGGVRGPVQDLQAEIEYLDVKIPPGKTFHHKIGKGRTALAYVWAGTALFGQEETKVRERHTALLSSGDAIQARAKDKELRMLLLSGEPLNEPIAWRGPIVMNTDKELETAYRELDEGTFIKQAAEEDKKKK